MSSNYFSYSRDSISCIFLIQCYIICNLILNLHAESNKKMWSVEIRYIKIIFGLVKSKECHMVADDE